MSAVPLQFPNKHFKRYYGREAAREDGDWYRPKDEEDLIFHLTDPFRRVRHKKKKIKSAPVKIVAASATPSSSAPPAVPMTNASIPFPHLAATPKGKSSSTPFATPFATPSSPSASSSASNDSLSTKTYSPGPKNLYEKPNYDLDDITIPEIDRLLDEKGKLIDRYKEGKKVNREYIKNHSLTTEESNALDARIKNQSEYIKRLGAQILELTTKKKKLEKAAKGATSSK